MSTKNDGGPAFPVPNLEDDPGFNGMTLRDYFAGEALPVAFSRYPDSRDGASKEAYLIADAMLKARGK